MPNIFGLLEQQHAGIITLLDQLGTVSGGGASESSEFDEAGLRRIIDHLVVASSRHEAAEELVFWPAVRRRMDSGRELSDEGLRQENDTKYMLDAIRFETSGMARTSELHQLASAIRSHIDYEEDQVWPRLRAVTGPLGRALLGRQFALALRTAPTRPHPRGPDRPAGLATAGMAAAAGDKLRDSFGGRNVPPPGETGMPAGPDAADFLEAEHARIDKLLERVQDQGEVDAGLGASIVRELSVHDSIEREHLYPVLRRRLPNGNELYGQWLADHGRIAAMLAEVDRRAPHDLHHRSTLVELVQVVRTHVAEEEGTVFASMRARMTVEERAALGRSLELGKRKAPTHPHSHIAGTGLGARLSRMVAAPLDKTRDKLSGRA